LRSYTNAHAVDHLSHLWQFFQTSGIQGRFRVSDTIRTLTGTDPQTLEQFFENKAEALGKKSSKESLNQEAETGKP